MLSPESGPSASPQSRTTVTRGAILAAALDVFSNYGSRGATTKRIAMVAGVNEVTLFRHFGSKEALLTEALRQLSRDDQPGSLPIRPQNVRQELAAWCDEQLVQLRASAPAIRTCMSELDERPELAESASAGPRRAFLDLSRYLARVREAGLSASEFDERGAASTLIGAIFSYALARDMMPEVFPDPPETALGRYVAMLLQAVGADEASRLALSDATGAPGG